MNLLCPNCQKMLTVPENCAGQMMQCPLCQRTFTAPALPKAPANAPLPPSMMAGPSESFNINLPPSGVYQLPPESKPPAPPAPPKPPAGATKKPPGPPPMNWDSAPAMTPELIPPPAGEGSYRHALPLRINPRFLRWMVPVALILVLVLSFFPWEGAYPGGVGVLTQNAWQAAFGGWSEDPVLKEKNLKGFPLEPDKDRPTSSLMMIFYMILLCIAVLLGLAFMVFNFLPANTAPFIQMLRRQQGLILGLVALAAFIFLGIEMVKGFKLQREVTSKVEEVIEPLRKEADTDEAKKMVEILAGGQLAPLGIRHSLWFRLAVTLHVVAMVGGFLEFWTRRRGNKPLPKLEFVW